MGSSIRKKLVDAKRGQGMTEYIIIVALIAIAAIGVVSLFGDNIRKLYAGAADAMAGKENVTVDTLEAKAELKEHKNLETFAKNNDPT